MSFQNRIIHLMEHYGLTAKDLAGITGVQRSAISHLINGRNKPSVAFVTQLTAHFPDLNVQWLLHGKGNVVTNVTNVTKESVGSEELGSDVSVDTVDKKIDKEQDVSRSVTNVSKTNISNKEAPGKSFTQEKSSGVRVTKIICVYSDGSTQEFNP